MAWDPAWETLFARKVLRSYPSEDLVRFVARRFYEVPDRADVRILELGSGTGAHLWYLAREGFAAAGIEASPSGVARTHELLEADGLEADVRLGDILDVDAVFPAESFDAVVDVGAIQSNTFAAAKRMVEAAARLIRPGGWIFADLIATGSTGEGQGREIEAGTFEEMSESGFAELGRQHFYTRAELDELFRGFDDVEINEWTRTVDHGSQVYRHWVVEGRRPS